MESDVAALKRGPGPGPAQQEGDRRYADAGRPVITRPDRPGIVAAVSEFLFEARANITKSQQYPTGPFGGTFFLRVEFRLDGAVGWHLEDRVFVHQNSTIVFS